MTPGLTLTDPRPLRARSSRTLLSGLTMPVQGFSALPEVAVELKSLRETEGGTLLQDESYVLKNVQQEFASRPITVLHIASHGQFSSDPAKTFLLTYDGKLTMDQLEKLIAPSRYRDEPLELLALSACQTAAGDDRAALGLAGVAIKAGARSALASLWFVNDQSSTQLITEFYRQLKQPGTTKAKALQQAQLKMITDARFSHPGYWAPYLLIGNWL
jgi:CHAT domain-containing protein